jgi:hypothetical protein
VAWGALGLLLVVSFWIDVDHTLQGGSIDLRNRVTGARLLVAGVDPYFYKWREPEPPEFCDPYNNPALPVSKTTATPALLLAGAPVAALPYRSEQFVWLVLQWLFLLGAAFLWLRRNDAEHHRLLLAAFVTGLTYTPAWRLHAERGQSYVLLLFLFAAWLVLTLRAKAGRAFWTGLLAGLLAALRPPFLLLTPFLWVHRRGQLPGALVGLALGIVLPLFWRADSWNQYAMAMSAHSSFYRNAIDPPPGPESFPPQIEGIPTDQLANYLAIPYADFSVHALLRQLGLEPFPSWPPLFAILTAYGLWLWRSRAQDETRRLLGVAVWLFLVDLFLPAYRNNYNDVLVLNIVALGLLQESRVPWGVWLCFLALPVGWGVAVTAPMDDALINLPSFCCALGALLLLFLFNSPVNLRKVGPAC